MFKIKRLGKLKTGYLYFSFGFILLSLVFTYLYFLNAPRFFAYLEKNTPKAFVSESYDLILKNYWENISETQLLELFKLSLEKNSSIKLEKLETKSKLLDEISKISKKKTEEENGKISAIVAAVLATLPPQGRSGLYGQKEELALKNTVDNVNPEKDLYKDIGISKNASKEAIQKAYEEKSEQATTEEDLKKLTYARNVLVNNESKLRYDQKQVEPTIFTKIYPSKILYLQFKKFSPTSLDEFREAFERHKDDDLDMLIFDLRGNIGGAIDSTAFFLGHFLGKGKPAFEFYQKGQYIPFITQSEKLPEIEKYKQIILLIDENSQSSAEMMAASFKKHKIGLVLGKTTKGWGSVERVFPLENQFNPKEKYSIFLVHSLTLRDDRQPIEGKGVEPDLNIGNTEWESKLFNHYRNSNLNYVIKTLL